MQGASGTPEKLLPKPMDAESLDESSLMIKMETEEEEIVGSVDDSDKFANGDDLESEIPCNYLAGELAWARVGTSPFWPCAFTYDPDLKIHSYISRAQLGGLVRSHRQVLKPSFSAKS